MGYQVDSRVKDFAKPTAFADMAIWSGCYLAIEALRYEETGDRDAAERIRSLVSGIDLLVNVTGKPGLLARGLKQRGDSSFPLGDNWHESSFDPNLIWLGDVSVDQIDGVLFGAGVAYDAINDISVKENISKWAGAIVDHILDHGMTIQDIDGSQTKHGDLTCGLFSEDLNCLIALMAVKVAFHVTGEKRFEKAYEELVRLKYPERAVSARRPWWEFFLGVNHSDNNLAFLAYFNLIRYENDPRLLKLYHKSLQRAWLVVRRDRNPFFTYLFRNLYPSSEKDPQALEEAFETLVFFPNDRRFFNSERVVTEVTCVSFFRDRQGRRQACSPLPIDLRPPTPIEWNENPSRLEGTDVGFQTFSNIDYLLGYWLGRVSGFLSSDA